ncbi:MAG: helix-turn-helix domain-containing protein, partial [Pseudonocardiaceae bacterium]
VVLPALRCPAAPGPADRHRVRPVPARAPGSASGSALGRVCPAVLEGPLADYDFGWLFRQVRAQTGWSQQTLGGVVDLTQAQVSAIERGTTRLIHVRLVAGVAQGLRIPGHLLGFPDYGPGSGPG